FPSAHWRLSSSRNNAPFYSLENLMHCRIVLIAGLLLAATSWSKAESTATLEKSHLCCGSCVKAANRAVESAGAKAQSDERADKIIITAVDDEGAQKAVDALVTAGFYGKVSGGTIKNDAGAPAGNVKSLSVTTHNCCKKCSTAINAVVKSVP